MTENNKNLLLPLLRVKTTTNFNKITIGILIINPIIIASKDILDLKKHCQNTQNQLNYTALINN